MGLHTSVQAKLTRPAALGALAGLALAVAACGSSTTTSASPTGSANSTAAPSATPSPTVSGTAARIGADCSMIPSSGQGSISSMTTQQAITAASSNPQLSVFIAAVRSAGLDKTLNARHAYTLMIPANSAFASLSKTQIVHLKNSGDLLNIVRYHALKARVSPQQFASGARPVTLQGKPLTLSKTGSAYKVNGATVLCGNIKTANATVYIVNKVLLPPG
jgi:uncharacterized surface protein with fasciclin (FAS1) repeats